MIQRLSALEKAQKKESDRLEPILIPPEIDSDSANYMPDAAEVDLFTKVRDFTGQLSGRASLSHKTIRSYLILSFLTLGLVLLGTDYAFRADGRILGAGPQIYGVSFEGSIHPAAEVRIASELTGTVSAISVKVGDTVQKGQPLLRLDDREAELALLQASADLNAAQANLDKFSAQLAEANARVAISQRQEQQVPTRQWRDSPERAEAAYDQVLTNYNRAKQLFDAGVIAQQDLDARATELRMARDDLDNARRLANASFQVEHDQSVQATLQASVAREELQNQLLQAKLKYQRSREQVDETVVRATQPGVVSEISVHLGDHIPAGTLLTRLAELDRMIVDVPIAGNMVSNLKVGQTAQVALPSSPPQHVEGHIRVISPLPSANRTHSVEVEFGNPALLLLAGQPAQVKFESPSK
ncbi:MAG: efflux RND transporter periplasmic adaptor subunit [Terriglobales bacterium]